MTRKYFNLMDNDQVFDIDKFKQSKTSVFIKRASDSDRIAPQNKDLLRMASDMHALDPSKSPSEYLKIVMQEAHNTQRFQTLTNKAPIAKSSIQILADKKDLFREGQK